MRAGVAPRPLVRGPALTRAALVLGAGGALLLAALVVGIGLGSVSIAPDDVLRVLGQARKPLGDVDGVRQGVCPGSGGLRQRCSDVGGERAVREPVDDLGVRLDLPREVVAVIEPLEFGIFG